MVMPKCCSIPSGVVRNSGTIMTAALLMSTSTRGVRARTLAAAARTDAWLPRSSETDRMSAPGDADELISSMTVAMAASVREARIRSLDCAGI